MERKVVWDKSLCGEKIAAIEDDGYRWYFNSRYDDNTIAEGWVNGIESSGRHDIFLVFGIANGVYIKKLREKYKDNVIVVFEPNEELYRNAEEDGELKDFLDKEEIILENEEHNLTIIMGNLVNYLNHKYVHYIITPNYDKVFRLETVRIRYMLAKTVENVMYNRNTGIIFEKAASKNCLFNMKDAFYQNTLADLIDGMKKYADRPAVIVSAGPSLDKNIMELKKVKNKVFIICVDSAVRVMVKAGILPDLIVTIDPKKSIKRFSLPEIQEIPMVCDIYFNHNVTTVYNGRRFYSFVEKGIVLSMVEDDRRNTVMSGGSVANTAFSVAENIGFHNIVLMGQDLSYPQGKKHAEAANVHGNNDINKNSRRYYEIDGYYGEKVMTESNLDVYRKWFEEVIAIMPHIHVYNATEGGAMINGAINIPLSRFIEEHCSNLEEVDFLRVINDIPKHFDEAARNERKEKIRNLKQIEVPEFMETIRSCKKQYEEFNKLNLQGKYTGQRFKTVAEKIIELQNVIKETDIMGFIENYNAVKTYTLEETLLDEQETPYEENKAIYKNGMELIDIYEESTEMFMDDLDEIFKDWLE